MKKIVVFLMMLLFCVAAFPVDQQNQNQKKYDMQFSLSGGTVKGQFSLAGEFAYAREFSGVFTQFSAMTNSVNDKGEYGFSAGIGAQGDTFQVYLFLDSLYRNKLWTQVRPMFRLNFGWLNLGASYSLPISKSKVQVGDDLYVSAAKIWQADFNLIPASFIRLYGDFKSLDNQYQKFQVGIEVRPIKMVSVKADWNKVDSHIYSNWSGFQDFRVTLNLLFGIQQNDFRQIPAQKVGPLIVRPSYPVLIARTADESKPPEPIKDRDVVEFLYKRTKPVVDNNATGPLGFTIWNTGGGRTIKRLTYLGDDQWMGAISLPYDKKAPYWIYTLDMKVTGVYETVGETFYARIQGTSEWKRLPCEFEPQTIEGLAAKLWLYDGVITIP